MSSLERKLDDLKRSQDDMIGWLWGKNGRVGDIVEVKAQLEKLDKTCDDISAILGTHTAEIEVLKDWKKDMPKWIIGAVVVALGTIGTAVKGLFS